MAALSNRSPSPLCSRPINPNPRNSEKISANRISFSGKPSILTNSRRFDPMTPANSPSDFGRRRSVGEEKGNDEKEDVLKASKIQSPAKGCKNFMSPTISAASKFTPSPRKKVLAERKDPVRTSISLSDGKAMFYSSNVTEHFDLNSGKENQKFVGSLASKISDSEKKKAVHDDHPASKPLKRVSFSDVAPDFQLESEPPSESVVTDPQSMKLDSTITDSSNLESSSRDEVVSPGIAQLDADPSLPPYDPKTNYLSPRPQFLFYKPNPRIEILYNKENNLEDFKRLQDDLIGESMSENFSDCCEGTDESQTDDSQNEEMDFTSSADADMVIGVDEVEADIHVSELSESFTSINNVTSEEDFVLKNGKKPRALFRLMCFSMILMFFIACVSIASITQSPDAFVQEDLSNFYHQSRDAVKVNFDWFVKNVNQLRISSVSYISQLASELENGGKQAPPLQFLNLSDLQINTFWSDGHFLNKETSKGLIQNLGELDLDYDLDTEMDSFEEEESEEVDSDEHESNSEEEDVLATETETYGEESYAQIDSHEALDKKINTEEDKVLTTELESDQTEVISSIDTNQCNEQNSIDHSVGVVVDHQEAVTTDMNNGQSDVDTVQSPSQENSFAYRAMGVSSLIAALLAVLGASIYRYKRSPSGPAPLLSKVLTGSKHNIQDEKDRQTEVEVIDSESCPSEMSTSFQRSASYSLKSGGAYEAVSSERRTRKFNKRESLASSSEFSNGSPSYGSFTTYERIPIKNGNGDEEIITPVRRSSRIRHHQITSP